jgi:hypothetical protein
MSKQIGPTFGDEIAAAGLSGLPFTWMVGGTDEDIAGREDLDVDQNATLDEVIVAHDPAVKSRRQEADEYLAAGLTVDFPSGQPGRGTYPVVEPFNHNYNAISTSLANGDGFPNNASMVGIFDTMNGMHNFDKVNFTKFSKAVRDFVHNCNLYAQGETIGLPPNEVTF